MKRKPQPKPKSEYLTDNETITCPNCNGCGWVSHGWGKYGDCNGDAAADWKACLIRCELCQGLCRIIAQ